LRIEAEKVAPLSDQDVADLVRGVPAGGGRMSSAIGCAPGLRIFRERFGGPTALVVAGGVAVNQAIRRALGRVASEHGTVLVAPPPELCTDNGAMIAWTGCRAPCARDDRHARCRAARALAARRRRVAAARRKSLVNFQRIAVVGAGAWGTALASCAARAGRDVTLWARDAANDRATLHGHERSPRLPGISAWRARSPATGAIADVAQADAVLLRSRRRFAHGCDRTCAAMCTPGGPVIRPAPRHRAWHSIAS
jgi:hypothetical protein